MLLKGARGNFVFQKLQTFPFNIFFSSGISTKKEHYGDLFYEVHELVKTLSLKGVY